MEGSVEQFHPKSQAGGGYETFKVGDVAFLYSDYESTPGFNQTASHGGLIREGLPVRVTYVFDAESSPHRNVIVKLEVAPR